ncbi:MAG: MBL fold metallo-hydrolase [Methanobacteriota archaeon]|nr:MAG: MBL fold metallo-hydrolase [Euryarchaeota archaeon]
MTPGPDAPEVRVLCEGYVVRNGSRVLDASSTVTLVISDECIAVVDTGSPFRSKELRKALAEADIAESEVDFVINTHLHLDHCGGNDIFTEASQLAHRLEQPPVGSMKVEDGHKVARSVSIRGTPGHTIGSISVLVDSDVRYAICGDAIPTRANYEARVPPAIHIDRRLAVESMEGLIRWADVIVPGHDAPFETLGKR